MSKHSGSGRVGVASRKKQARTFAGRGARRLGFDRLEDRRLLSTVGLSPISNVTLPAGTSVLVALNGDSPGKTVHFSVWSSDPSRVTPAVMPQTNKTVELNLENLGKMSFQLFDNLTPNTASHIETLVNAGFYNNDYIYRAQSGFVVQGGNQVPVISNGQYTGQQQTINTLPSGVPATIAEEFSPSLVYTTAGTLAMARTSAADSSGTEFFVGAAATRSLDFNYTLFGFQTVDQSITYNGSPTTVRQAIESMPTESNSGLGYLLNPVKITSASVVTDTQNGVLMLRAPTTATGDYDITVTAYDDGTNTATTRSFIVHVVADTAAGVVVNPYASKTPTAPTSVVFQPQSGQGTATYTKLNNSSAAQKLQFLVSGMTAGNRATVYADGVAIGSATATGSTVTVTTDGTFKLLDGGHKITAVQTVPSASASWTGTGLNRTKTADVPGFSSPILQLNVDTVAPTITSTPSNTANVGEDYTYTVTTDVPSGDAANVTPGAMPAGMYFDSSTNTFHWTPELGQAGSTVTYSATVRDSAGNPTSTGTISVTVGASVNGLEILAPPANVAVGSPVLVAVNSANAGTPNFTAVSSDLGKLAVTFLPQTNRVLKIVTDMGEMQFQLFDNLAPNTVQHFVDLVNSGTYASDAAFYRIIKDFMIQGGSGGSGTGIPVELNADLRFTTSGLLAMANNGVDGNYSEFFVTSANNTNNGFLDFRYTVFGKLIHGENVREAISRVPVTTNTGGENSQPITEPKITSVSIVTSSTRDAVLMLKAQTGATGSYTVTVTDGLGGSQNMVVNIGANSFDPPNPWVKPINGTDKLSTAANTPVTFTPEGVSADGSAVTVSVQVFREVPNVTPANAFVDDSYTQTDPPATTPNPNITLVKNGSSYTVTPASGYYGVQVLEVMAQSASAAAWTSTAGVDPVYRAFVPVFVAPPAPQISSITVGGQTVTGSTFANNASAATKLSFNIASAIAGATVSVYVNGVSAPIASGTVASGATTITVTTDGTTQLADGARQFTVKQTVATPQLNLYAAWSTVNGQFGPGAQFPIPADTIVSAASPATTLSIGLAVLAPPAGSVRVGSQYTYVVQTNAPAGTTVTVTPVNMPSGMQFDGNKTFTWTPTNAQLNTSPTFRATVADSQGRTTSIGPTNITVVLGLTPTQIPIRTAQGGDVTVFFSGNTVKVYDNIAKAVLSTDTFVSTDTVEVDCPAGQANHVLVLLPSAGAAIPREIYVAGAAASTNNQVTVFATAGADTFTMTAGNVVANGLGIRLATVQKLTLAGMGGDDAYNLNAGSVPTWIIDTGGYNSADFSQNTAGVAVNLGLDRGQTQTIAPWNTTLNVYGVIGKLTGTAYADVLTGGNAATTLIRGGLGNDTITGGSGNNILLGVGGNDTIYGGRNKNLIIGGAGDCLLYARGTENSVFGGSTNLDANDSALLNLLNQGPRVLFSYSARRMMASVGANSLQQTGMFSFQDQGARDTIFSSGGNNWFVPGRNGKVQS